MLEAKVLKSETIGTEHLMLSILKNKDNIATQILGQFDVDYDIFRQELDFVKTVLLPDLPSNSAEDEPYDDDEKGERQFSVPRKRRCRQSKNPYWTTLAVM